MPSYEGIFLCSISVPIEVNDKLVESKGAPHKLKYKKRGVAKYKGIIAQYVSTYKVEDLVCM